MSYLFHQKNETYSHVNAEFAVYINANSITLSVMGFGEQQFWPMSFEKNNKIVGGAFVYPWICGSKSQKKNIGKNTFNIFNTRSIKFYITGMCMFGDSLMGIDVKNLIYILTDTKQELHQDVRFVVIKDSCVASELSLHAYEMFILNSLINFIPFMKALGEQQNVAINFHLPVPEYQLYGIRLYFENKMSFELLLKYIDIVSAKGAILKKHLESISILHQIQIKIHSPLDDLNIAHVLNDIKNMIYTTEKSLLDFFIGKLLVLQNEFGKTWQHFFKSKSFSRLQDLNNASYVIMLAGAVIKYGAENVCLMDNFDEIPIGREYSKHFSQAFGEVLAFHWLSSVFLHDGVKNSIYYCGASQQFLASEFSEKKLISNGKKIAKLAKVKECKQSIGYLMRVGYLFFSPKVTSDKNHLELIKPALKTTVSYHGVQI